MKQKHQSQILICSNKCLNVLHKNTVIDTVLSYVVNKCSSSMEIHKSPGRAFQHRMKVFPCISKFKPPHITATQTVSKKIRKKRPRASSMFSPHLQVQRKFHHNETQPFKLIYWKKKKKEPYLVLLEIAASTHSSNSFQKPQCKALPAQACRSQQTHPGLQVMHLLRGECLV